MLTIISFGYKYGRPSDVDPRFVIDCRDLPNPHHRRDLRELTGKDKAVQGFVKRTGEHEDLLAVADDMLAGGATTVAFGCVGGRHRSVSLAELAAEKFTAEGYAVKVVHRELD